MIDREHLNFSLWQVDNWAISTPIIPCYLKTYKDKTIPFACFWMNLFLNFPPAPKMIRQIDQFEHNPWPICIWRRCHWQLIENKCWIVILSTHVYGMIDVKWTTFKHFKKYLILHISTTSWSSKTNTVRSWLVHL